MGTALVNPGAPTHIPACSKLLVSNLPLNFDENAVYKFLREFGKIKSLEMIKDPITGNYSVKIIFYYRDNAMWSSKRNKTL